MADHFPEVRAKLGEGITKQITDYAMAGKISANKMRTIAQILGATDNGEPTNIYQRQKRRARGEMDTEEQMRQLLSDWWAAELGCGITGRKGLEKLIATFDQRDVELKPLAEKLRKPWHMVPIRPFCSPCPLQLFPPAPTTHTTEKAKARGFCQAGCVGPAQDWP